MNVTEAIKNRSSTRAYLDKPVPKETITEIFDTARWSPSGTNTQPWKVMIAQGETRKMLSNAFLDALDKGIKPKTEYDYYPLEWIAPYKNRRFECGMALYKALGIGREDTEKRLEAAKANYRFFDAPVAIFFFIDNDLSKGSWFDMGMFLQSVMLTALEHGLATCPQLSMAEYPNIAREIMGVPDNFSLICGVSMGYPDLEKPVNQFRTSREEVNTFTTWFD